MSSRRSSKATRKARAQKPRRRPGGSRGRGADDRDARSAVREAAARAEADQQAIAATLLGIATDQAAQEVAVGTMPLVTQAGTLLAWVRRGPRGSRQVTATGALRRADLVEAAAIVGVTVQTARAAPDGDRGQAHLPLERLPSRPDLPVGSVRGMADVLPLARVWQALATTGIVDVGRAAAQLGPLAVDWLDGSAQQKHKALAVFLVAYLVHTFEEKDRLPWALSRGMMNAQALLSVLLEGPRTTAQLDAVIPGFAFLGEHELDRLAALGVLRRSGDRLSVATGLEQLVAGALWLFLFDDVEGPS